LCASPPVRAAFRGPPRFSTWFYRILVNLCLDHRRRGRWWQRLLMRPDEAGEPEAPSLERQPAPPVARGAVWGAERTLAGLWPAVDRLSPQQRAAIVLHAQEELPTSQIAEVLKCSEATVRVHLHRAVSSLAQLVRQDGACTPIPS